MSDYFSENLKSGRKTLEITQDVFAESLGVTGGYISDLEKRKRMPSETLVLLICLKFGLSRNWLVHNDGEMFLQEANQEEELHPHKLKQVITWLKRWEIETKQKFEPEDFADPTIKIYEFYIESGEEVSKETFARLIKPCN